MMISKQLFKEMYVRDAFIARYGAVVRRGPFTGMKYVTTSIGSSLCPKLLGCYEQELHPWITELLNNHYDCIVNIGCGEGYYAVGFAIRLPKVKVFAFDTNVKARSLCREVAIMNNVSKRIVIDRDCSHETLNMLTQGKTFVMIDCEGCELSLLDPILVPNLRQVDVLVETHDFINPEISKKICSHFVNTHVIKIMNSSERNPSDYPELQFLRDTHRRIALTEFRPEVMKWFLMQAKFKPV